MIIRLIDSSISMRGREAAQRYRLRRILQLKPTQLKEDQLCLQDLKKARLKQTSHQKLETRRRKSTESAHLTTAGALSQANLQVSPQSKSSSAER